MSRARARPRDALRRITAGEQRALALTRAALWVAALVCLTLPMRGARAESSLDLQLRVGGHYNMLDKPADPRGEVTLLNGSGFAGVGYLAGVDIGWVLWRPSASLALALEGGAHYSQHTAEGFAEDASAGQKRTITLRTTALRMPLLASLRYRLVRAVELRASLGPEVLWGLSSGAEVVEEGFEMPAQPLATTPVNRLGVSVGLGAAVRRGALVLPIELRMTFDPAVGATTRDRLVDYVSVAQPGSYAVAFNRQLLLVLGLGYSF